MLAMNGQGRTRGKVATLEIAAACNQSLAALTALPGLEPRFLLHNLESRYEELRDLTGDEARSGLNLALIRALPLLLPPPTEQSRIAEVLDAIDSAIEKTEAVLSAMRELKSGTAAGLLSGRIGCAAPDEPASSGRSLT